MALHGQQTNTRRAMSRLERHLRPPPAISLEHCRGLRALSMLHAIDPRLPTFARERWRFVSSRYAVLALELECYEAATQAHAACIVWGHTLNYYGDGMAT